MTIKLDIRRKKKMESSFVRKPFPLLDVFRKSPFCLNQDILLDSVFFKHLSAHFLGYVLYTMFVLNRRTSQKGRSIKEIFSWFENQIWGTYESEIVACQNPFFIKKSRLLLENELKFYKKKDVFLPLI